MAARVAGVEDRQRGKGEDRRRDAEDQQPELECRGRGDEPGVDGRPEGESVGADVGRKARVHTDDLRPGVGIPQIEGPDSAGLIVIRPAPGAGGVLRQTLDRPPRAFGVGFDDDPTVRRRLCGRARSVEQHDVSLHDLERVSGGPDEEADLARLRTAFRHRRQQHAAGRGQRRPECAWHPDVHRDRDERHVRGRDVGHRTLLRPGQFGLRVVDRQERAEEREQDADDTGGHCDDACGAGVPFREARAAGLLGGHGRGRTRAGGSVGACHVCLVLSGVRVRRVGVRVAAVSHLRAPP